MITIRLANQDDAALLASLGARTFYEAFASDNTPENMQDYLNRSFSPEIQSKELLEAGSVFLIAESEGTAIGYARLLAGWPDVTCITGSNPVELVRIYLLQDWIHQGAGSKLMQACLDEARGRGHDVIWLGVWEKNARAIAFYQKWGFEKAGSHIFKLGDEAQTDWIMQRKL